MKTKFTTPRKDSKSRNIALMLLRDEGATMQEIRETTGMSSVVAHGVLARLDFDCGFDIRRFTEKHIDPTTSRPPLRYRIVGRSRWNGGYRSFVEGSI